MTPKPSLCFHQNSILSKPSQHPAITLTNTFNMLQLQQSPIISYFLIVTILMERHQQTPLLVCRTRLTPQHQIYYLQHHFHQPSTTISFKIPPGPGAFKTSSTSSQLTSLHIPNLHPSTSPIAASSTASSSVQSLLLLSSSSPPTLHSLPPLPFPPHLSSYSTFAPFSFLSNQTKTVCHSCHPAL